MKKNVLFNINMYLWFCSLIFSLSTFLKTCVSKHHSIHLPHSHCIVLCLCVPSTHPDTTEPTDRLPFWFSLTPARLRSWKRSVVIANCCGCKWRTQRQKVYNDLMIWQIVLHPTPASKKKIQKYILGTSEIHIKLLKWSTTCHLYQFEN